MRLKDPNRGREFKNGRRPPLSLIHYFRIYYYPRLSIITIEPVTNNGYTGMILLSKDIRINYRQKDHGSYHRRVSSTDFVSTTYLLT